MNFKKILLNLLIIMISSIILYTIYANMFNKQEPFIGHLYRPHIRTINNLYENFMNNYGPHRIVNKINKWFNY
jgi:hypothetical protein